MNPKCVPGEEGSARRREGKGRAGRKKGAGRMGRVTAKVAEERGDRVRGREEAGGEEGKEGR